MPSHANSAQPSHNSSSQPSQAASFNPSHATDSLIQVKAVEHLNTPNPDPGWDAHASPASVTTRVVDFDHVTFTPNSSNDENFLEPWETDEGLTPQEWLQISHEKSVYERERAYNITHNEKSVAAMELTAAVQSLCP